MSESHTAETLARPTDSFTGTGIPAAPLARVGALLIYPISERTRVGYTLAPDSPPVYPTIAAAVAAAKKAQGQ